MYIMKSSNRTHTNSNARYQDKEGKGDSDVECFIQKPIDIDELVKRIKEELN